MLFSSITFIYYFLPVTAGLYFLSLKGAGALKSFFQRLPNGILLLCSLVFYGWGEPKYVFLMMVSTLSCYGFGLLVEKYREGRKGRAFALVSVMVSLSFLVYFKYADFFLENFNALAGWQVPLLKVALPVGISFYTFQIISYTVDVYRGEDAQKNFIDLALYVAMFPQLVAGPIVRYSGLSRELAGRRHFWEIGRAHV